MEDGTIGDEIENGLEHPSSKLNWIQKIISSARMGGISGPLVRVLVITRMQIVSLCSLPLPLR